MSISSEVLDLDYLNSMMDMNLLFSRFYNGTWYLQEKYGHEDGAVEAIMSTWFNLGLAFVFPLALFFLNLILYLIPLPAFVKAKFRE